MDRTIIQNKINTLKQEIACLLQEREQIKKQLDAIEARINGVMAFYREKIETAYRDKLVAEYRLICAKNAYYNNKFINEMRAKSANRKKSHRKRTGWDNSFLNR